MRACMTVIVVLVAFLFEGCAFGAPNGVGKYPYEVHRQVSNEVLGDMEHVLIFEGSHQVGDDCFYRAKERYQDRDGRKIVIQGVEKTAFNLVGIDDATCSIPTDKLIRLVGVREVDFLDIRAKLISFISGENRSQSSELPALLGSPVSIAKKDGCYELAYRGATNRILCVDFSEDIPKVRAIRSWQ